MHKLVAPFAAFAFVFAAAIAQADETAGTVAAADMYTLVLEDGTTFTLAEGLSLEGLEPGTEVTVSYEEQDGKLVATEVAPAS